MTTFTGTYIRIDTDTNDGNRVATISVAIDEKTEAILKNVMRCCPADIMCDPFHGFSSPVIRCSLDKFNVHISKLAEIAQYKKVTITGHFKAMKIDPNGNGRTPRVVKFVVDHIN
jgi:hypothetical protein